MRFRPNKLGMTTDLKITGYSLWLSARDTHDWARKPGAVWPNSTIGGHRLFVGVDGGGLTEITLDGHQFNASQSELIAIVTDHLPDSAKHLWPVWSHNNK